MNLREFKVKFCDPVTAYIVGVAIAATGWLAKTLLSWKKCKIDWCGAWVKRKELYCKRGHKQ